MSHVDDLDAILRELDVEFEHPSANAFVVALPGEKRLKTACWLTVGAHGLDIQAFVLRRPEENHERVYAVLLQHNARMYAVAWAMDSMGDIYLSGRVPLAAINADDIDRVLGSVLEYSDGMFNHLLELGFGSSIRREWDWRVKRGESLANLQAFAAFAQRSAANDELSAQRSAANDELSAQRSAANDELTAQRSAANDELTAQRSAANDELSAQRGDRAD